MGLFMFQKTTRMTFCTERCACYILFTECLCVSPPWTVFLTLAFRSKTMFSTYVSIFWLKHVSRYTSHILVWSLLSLLAGPSESCNRIPSITAFQRKDGRSKSRADSGPNRRPVSAGQPSGGRAAFQIPMHVLYSTRPHGLVQAIFWHTCPDLDLGPWYGLTH